MMLRYPMLGGPTGTTERRLLEADHHDARMMRRRPIANAVVDSPSGGAEMLHSVVHFLIVNFLELAMLFVGLRSSARAVVEDVCMLSLAAPYSELG